MTGPDILIIGAGPAGLMAACHAAAAGRRVLLLERMPSPGRKLLTTGGGRCNLTHEGPAGHIIEAFGRRGAFMRPALAAMGPSDLRAFFDRLGVPTTVEPDGCVFPVSQSARHVLDALLRMAERHGAVIRTHAAARGLRVRDNRVIGVELTDAFIPATDVILAAGGRGYPQLGSDGSGFQLAAAAGHTIVPPVPGLVPLVARSPLGHPLPGLVLSNGAVRIEARGAPAAGRAGPVLFTHKGLSGPPVLDSSADVMRRLAATPGSTLRLGISVRADRAADDWLQLFADWRRLYGGRAVHNLLAGEMPRNLAVAMAGAAGLAERAAAQAPAPGLQRLAALCAACPFEVSDSEGWDQAMVTSGGVALNEIDPVRLTSRRIAGLRFAGEVVDLDGPCGGYNLTWAFASGWLAGSE